MKKLSALVLACLTAGALAQTTCQTVGQNTFCSDGRSYIQSGNTTFGSDGSTAQRIGNSTIINPGYTPPPPVYTAPAPIYTPPPQPYQQQQQRCGVNSFGRYGCM